MGNMARTIAELKALESQQSQALRATIDKIEQLKDAAEIPALRKKYRGKYFKTINSYGSSTPDWWIYYRVLDVTSRTECMAFAFQVIPTYDGKRIEKVEFEPPGTVYLNMLTHPSSKAEFDREYKKALAKIQNK